MSKCPKSHKDVEYYVTGRKKSVAGSTRATGDFLSIVHGDSPALTIRQLRELISDRSRYIFQLEAAEVLEAHIQAGYGDYIPEWR